MRAHLRNGRPCPTTGGQPSILKIRVNSREKSKLIDLGLAILAATRPGERLTCAEIAAYCACCPERINQIEHRALKRFRGLLTLLEQPPERVTTNEAAWIINCRPREVPILVEMGLLKPLGHRQPDGVTFFDGSELLELVKDPAWQVKVRNVLNDRWHDQDTRR